MSNILKLKERWESHERKRFPLGIRGKVFKGANLSIVESDIARGVLTIIELERGLRSHMLSRVEEQNKVLHDSLEVLEGDAEAYFNELAEIADMAIAISR